MYTVYIIKSGIEMQHGVYDSFDAAASIVRYIKSTNMFDDAYIDETWFQSGLSKR